MKIYGWQDISKYNQGYFATIYPVPIMNPITKKMADFGLPEDLKDVKVVGRIVSDNIETNTSWESPLEGSNSESGFSFTTALAQSGLLESFTDTNKLIGRTLVNKTEAIQVFKGLEPQTLNLTLEFVAQRDSFIEVELALRTLMKMSLPQLTNGISSVALETLKNTIKGNDINTSINDFAGYIPFDIIVVKGNKRYNANRYILTNVSSDRDELKLDRNGNDIHRQVNVTLKSKQALMRDEIILI
jgi:hypothetical protein